MHPPNRLYKPDLTCTSQRANLTHTSWTTIKKLTDSKSLLPPLSLTSVLLLVITFWQSLIHTGISCLTHKAGAWHTNSWPVHQLHVYDPALLNLSSLHYNASQWISYMVVSVSYRLSLSLSLCVWMCVCVCVLIKVSGTVNVINAISHNHTVIPMWQMINEESQPHSWED